MKADKKKKKRKEEPGSFFQRQRVDLLLGELAKKFPPKFVAPSQPEARPTTGNFEMTHSVSIQSAV